MTFTGSADPSKFDAAVQWFRDRLPMTDSEFESLTADEESFALVVAGVQQLDAVTDVWDALDLALSEGIDFDTFKELVTASLESAWSDSGEGPSNTAWRIETIFRTNVLGAYAAGRYEMQTDEAVLEARPYWLFDAVKDTRTTEVCEACNGKVVAADDSWWDGHYPPCHFNCRSVVTTLDEEQAQAMGITSSPPSIQADDGFGDAPERPTWEPSKRDYPTPLWNEFESKQDDAQADVEDETGT